ncbi:MAG: SDR family oxidoreductase [Parachlamydiaceae bacterium]|nr:SDR family oxidoreductase [Parachlamydiaceae bacterium]
MDDRTNNLSQWTLVTGGAKGLGAEICKTLARQGHNILIHYRSSYKEALLIKDLCCGYGVKADLIQGDFSSMEQVNEFILILQKRFPHSIDKLVNNVGNYCVSLPLETADAEWLALFQTNLHAPVALMRALMPVLVSLHGSIINIGVAGINHVPSDVYSTAYTASKLALWMTSKALAKEFAPQGVRVNMVSPGLLENTVEGNSIIKFVPMQRLGSLKEAASVVAFLLDDENSYITGQNIEVGGGIRL